MSDVKKYYYLKLKDNFFDTEELTLLESMPDGYLYSNILLKLYLRSLRNEGKLMFKDTIPYNAQMLSSITKHSVGIIEKALTIFKQLKLIEILDDGQIYMLDIQNYIGKSSSEADRKRIYYDKIKNSVEKSPEVSPEECMEKSPEKSPEKCMEKPPEVSHEVFPPEIRDKRLEIREKERNTKERKKLIPLDNFTDDEKKAIEEFVQHRVTLKKPLSELAFAKLQNKLLKLKQDKHNIVELIDKSVISGYTDVYLPFDFKANKLKQQTREQLNRCNDNFKERGEF